MRGRLKRKTLRVFPVAQYDVDINLALKGVRELKLFDDRLKQLNAKLKELNKVQNNIGKRNPYSAAGKRVTQFGKEINEAREIIDVFAQSNKNAAASMDQLLKKQASFNQFFRQAADVRQAIRAANQADRKAANQRTRRQFGTGASSALIGGGFPLLFGQSGAAAAGGALGGLGGGLLGGQFGFALSIVGTAIGQAVEEAEKFDKALAGVNAKAADLGLEAKGTAQDVKNLAEQFGVTKDEALELVGAFSEFENFADKKALTRIFGSSGAAFDRLAAANTELALAQEIFAARDDIGVAETGRLLNALKITDASTVELALAESRLQAEHDIAVEKAKQVTFMDRLNAAAITAGMAGVGGGVINPAEFGRKRAEELEEQFIENRTDALGRFGEKLKEIRALLKGVKFFDPEDPPKISKGPKTDPTINLSKRLNILNKQIVSEEKFADTSAVGESIIRRKLALESKIAKIQETGTAERKRLTDQEDISLSNSIESKAIKLENLRFEREATALIERQNKAGERLLEPLQRKLDAIRDRNAFEKEYGDLIMNGSTPAAAKQVIEAQKQKKEIDRLVEKQLESNEILIANLRIKVAETENTKAHAAAVDALNDALRRRNKIEEKGRTAKGEVKGKKTPAENIEAEMRRIQGVLNDLVDPANQVIAAANAIGNAFSESFKGLITGSMSAQEALANLFSRTADHFADMAAQMIANAIRMKILGIALNFFGSAAGSAAQGSFAGVPNSTLDSVLPSTSSLADAAASTPLRLNAAGSYVSGPTATLVGEGGQGEYIIPESKMRESMARYSRGARGSSVIPEAGGSGTSGEGGGVAVAAPIDVRYSVERINSVDYVTADQFQQGIRQAADQGAKQGEQQTLKRLQMSSSTRKRLGM